MFLRGLLIVPLLLLSAGPALAQPSMPSLPDLTGPQKKILLLIAREAVDSILDNRVSREPTVEPRLMERQPMVISIYVDGTLRARAWRLREARPLYREARDLTYQALDTPQFSDRDLSMDELARAEVGLAILSHYGQVQDETEVAPHSGVIIYNGFTEWLALPGDIPSDQAADLLTYACEQAGLRPKVWLLPQTTIYAAKVEAMRESTPGGW